MPINWKNQDATDRLWAAVLASKDQSIDCNEVARIYGQGATYNSVECQMRKFKKAAAELKKEASGRDGPAPSPAKARAKKAVGEKGVKTGRVAKTKTAGLAKVKHGGAVQTGKVESEVDDYGVGVDVKDEVSEDSGGEFV